MFNEFFQMNSYSINILVYINYDNKIKIYKKEILIIILIICPK